MVSFIPFLAVLIASILIIYRARQPYRAEGAKLTPDDLKAFNEQFRHNSAADTPKKFQEIRAASDQLKHANFTGCVAVACAIAYVLIGELSP
jgi:hypothetical protein